MGPVSDGLRPGSRHSENRVERVAKASGIGQNRHFYQLCTIQASPESRSGTRLPRVHLLPTLPGVCCPTLPCTTCPGVHPAHRLHGQAGLHGLAGCHRRRRTPLGSDSLSSLGKREEAGNSVQSCYSSSRRKNGKPGIVWERTGERLDSRGWSCTIYSPELD